MKPHSLIALLLIGVGSGIAMQKVNVRQPCPVINVETPNGRSIIAEAARTTKEQQAGLSNRQSLEPGTGMLFLFPRKDYYTFWMKDTLIPLDIIWIADKKVVEIKQLAPPDGSMTPQHTPAAQADSVLELAAGQARYYSIEVGSHLTWNDRC